MKLRMVGVVCCGAVVVGVAAGSILMTPRVGRAHCGRARAAEYRTSWRFNRKFEASRGYSKLINVLLQI